jgi:hypothetical protein
MQTESFSNPLDSGDRALDHDRGDFEPEDVQTAREPVKLGLSLANLTPAYHEGGEFAGAHDWWAKQLGRS